MRLPLLPPAAVSAAAGGKAAVAASCRPRVGVAVGVPRRSPPPPPPFLRSAVCCARQAHIKPPSCWRVQAPRKQRSLPDLRGGQPKSTRRLLPQASGRREAGGRGWWAWPALQASARSRVQNKCCGQSRSSKLQTPVPLLGPSARPLCTSAFDVFLCLSQHQQHLLLLLAPEPWRERSCPPCQLLRGMTPHLSAPAHTLLQGSGQPAGGGWASAAPGCH